MFPYTTTQSMESQRSTRNTGQKYWNQPKPQNLRQPAPSFSTLQSTFPRFSHRTPPHLSLLRLKSIHGNKLPEPRLIPYRATRLVTRHKGVEFPVLSVLPPSFNLLPSFPVPPAFLPAPSRVLLYRVGPSPPRNPLPNFGGNGHVFCGIGVLPELRQVHVGCGQLHHLLSITVVKLDGEIVVHVSEALLPKLLEFVAGLVQHGVAAVEKSEGPEVRVVVVL